MQRYDPDRLLVSLHIPKSAGTSLRAALAGWFGERFYLHYPAWAPTLPILADEGRTCVHGHFTPLNGTSILQVFPFATQTITVMREPFSRLVSEWIFYNYAKSIGVDVPELSDEPDFDTWFCRRRDEAINDPVTRVLKQFPAQFDKKNPSKFFFNKGFVAVGITERFSDILPLFAYKFDAPLSLEQRYNVSPILDTKEFNRYKSEHKRVYYLEHEVYAAAESLFASDFETMISDIGRSHSGK
nr:sulfotransferase family 2 domain-containing protein [Brevundimonas subvibrioides]